MEGGSGCNAPCARGSQRRQHRARNRVERGGASAHGFTPRSLARLSCSASCCCLAALPWRSLTGSWRWQRRTAPPARRQRLWPRCPPAAAGTCARRRRGAEGGAGQRVHGGGDCMRQSPCTPGAPSAACSTHLLAHRALGCAPLPPSTTPPTHSTLAVQRPPAPGALVGHGPQRCQVAQRAQQQPRVQHATFQNRLKHYPGDRHQRSAHACQPPPLPSPD